MFSEAVDVLLYQLYLERAKSCQVPSLMASYLLTCAQELQDPALIFSPFLARLPFHLTYDSALHTGLVRASSPNEDNALAIQGLCFDPDESPTSFTLLLVADGMGGHANGREASQLASNAFIECLLPSLVGQHISSFDVLQELLVAGVQNANLAVWQQNKNIPDAQARMGTTMTVCLSVSDHIYIANVGDSRAYRFSRGQISQVTRDHSLVYDLFTRNYITREQMHIHPRRNIIHRALGRSESVQVDVFGGVLLNNDIVLLCSDGLWEMVPQQSKIEEILANPKLTIAQMTSRLVQLALAMGGRDNISAVVARVYVRDIGVIRTLQRMAS